MTENAETRLIRARSMGNVSNIEATRLGWTQSTLLLWPVMSLLVGLTPFLCTAETPGAVDPSFVPPRLTNGVGGPTGIVTQPDGKIVISGWWSDLEGLPGSQGLVRLEQDGTLDPTFDFTRVSIGGGGRDVAIQSDGKILVAANFFHFDGIGVEWGLIRLDPDGSPDTSFNPSTTGPVVDRIEIQPDELILVSGDFTRHLKRLHLDGSEDLAFDPGSGPNNDTITAIKCQDDGKILITGSFTTFNGVTSRMIVRLMPDGSIDSSFSSPFPRTSWIRSIALQRDGRIIVGGWFSEFDGSPTNYIARLNPNGSFDNSFATSTSYHVESVAIDRYGRILLAGEFTAVNGSARDYVARLLPDGGLDEEFIVRSGPSSRCYIVHQLESDFSLVGGPFASAGGSSIAGLARLCGGPAVKDTVPDLRIARTGSGWVLSFQPRVGVTYQMQCSEDLQRWESFGDEIVGSDLPPEIAVLEADGPARKFFRLTITE